MAAGLWGSGRGRGGGQRLDLELGLDRCPGDVCVGDTGTGACRTLWVKPLSYVGEKEIGAAALARGLGRKGRGQAGAAFDQYLIFFFSVPRGAVSNHAWYLSRAFLATLFSLHNEGRSLCSTHIHRL